MYNEKVSVIIPLYNKAHTIERTLRSVFSQTYTNFEVIIIDDGSTDGSTNIIKEEFKDERLKIIVQQNKGVSYARNVGIENAKGDYIAFLDADDEWLPYYLQTVLEESRKHPKAGLICVPALHRDIVKGFGEYHTVKRLAGKSSIVNVFESIALMAQTSGIVFKTSELNLFNGKSSNVFPTDMTYAEDVLTFYSFAMTTQTLYIGFPLSIRNNNVKSQITASTLPQIQYDCLAKYLNRLYDNYVSHNIKISYFDGFFKFILRSMINKSIKDGCFKKFIAKLSKDVQRKLCSIEIFIYNNELIPTGIKVITTRALRLNRHIFF